MKNKNKSVHRFKKHLALITLILIAAGAGVGLTIRYNNLNRVASSLDESAQPLYKLEEYLRDKYASSISSTVPVHKTCYKVFRLKYDKGEKWCGHKGEQIFLDVNIESGEIHEILGSVDPSKVQLGNNDVQCRKDSVCKLYTIRNHDQTNGLCAVNTEGGEGMLQISYACTRPVLDFLPGYPVEDR